MLWCLQRDMWNTCNRWSQFYLFDNNKVSINVPTIVKRAMSKLITNTQPHKDNRENGLLILNTHWTKYTRQAFYICFQTNLLNDDNDNELCKNKLIRPSGGNASNHLHPNILIEWIFRVHIDNDCWIIPGLSDYCLHYIIYWTKWLLCEDGLVGVQSNVISKAGIKFVCCCVYT